MTKASALTLRTGAAVLLTILLMTGCGTWQSVKETSSGAARAIFATKVKQMNLIFESRTELNRDDTGVSLPVAMQVYQLKDAKAFGMATYAQLLTDAGSVLKAEAVSRTDIVLGPDSAVALNAPMADDAQYIGIAAFFRDRENAEWQLTIPKAQWKKADPVRISVIGNRLELAP
ncbi:type VI secretion system lipoprotein TssJ [Trinickia sp. LjRoot230]|uniref:type VI secretion system lipoprotein TssJ n=1 Tax=Trinickia sp. LjRoot230 TaxID=3342288 RepID=UPI003ECCE504